MSWDVGYISLHGVYSSDCLVDTDNHLRLAAALGR